MVCETYLKPRQTPAERLAEVKKVADRVNTGLAGGRLKVRVGPQGAIAFEGLTEQERDGVSDACIYRRLMVQGSSLARTAITRAEQMAGRSVNKQIVGQGVHSHDGGKTWHNGH